MVSVVWQKYDVRLDSHHVPVECCANFGWSSSSNLRRDILDATRILSDYGIRHEVVGENTISRLEEPPLIKTCKALLRRFDFGVAHLVPANITQGGGDAIPYLLDCKSSVRVEDDHDQT